MSGIEPTGCAPEEGLVILDLRNGSVFFSDGRMEEILGLNAGEFAGVAWRQLLDPSELPDFARHVDDANACGEALFHYRHGNGRDWVPVRTRFVRQGETMTLCVRDATMTCAEQKLLAVRKQIDSWAGEPAGECGA